MSNVIMTCGLICCGKSTYAKKLKDENYIILRFPLKYGRKESTKEMHLMRQHIMLMKAC